MKKIIKTIFLALLIPAIVSALISCTAPDSSGKTDVTSQNDSYSKDIAQSDNSSSSAIGAITGTTIVSSTTTTTANVQASLAINDNFLPITCVTFFWGTSQSSLINAVWVFPGSSSQTMYNAVIPGLNPNTAYFVEAVAYTDAAAYSTTLVQFTTAGPITATISVGSITTTTANVYATLKINVNSISIRDIRFFWNGGQNNVASTLSFPGNVYGGVMTGLTPGTPYNVYVMVTYSVNNPSTTSFNSAAIPFTTSGIVITVPITMITVPSVILQKTDYYKNVSSIPLSSYKIAQTETTYSLWSNVYNWAIKNGYTFANAGSCGSNGGSTSQPVTMISWRDMIIWCNAFSQMNNLTPVYYTDSGLASALKAVDNSQTITTIPGTEDNPYVNWSANGYRLPTEAEWEYAGSYGLANPKSSLAGATGDYTNNAACSAVAVYGFNYDTTFTNVTTTANVGSKLPNALGLYDMSGNVAEYCWDWYDPDLFSDTYNKSNPHGLATYVPGYPARFAMGGGYDFSEFYCIPGEPDKQYNNPSNRNQDYGFRVVTSGQ